jgi:hypothetical protein
VGEQTEGDKLADLLSLWHAADQIFLWAGQLSWACGTPQNQFFSGPRAENASHFTLRRWRINLSQGRSENFYKCRRLIFKGIVSRDFVVCFLVSFDRSYISTHQERVLLLLKVRFCFEFFDFRVWAWWAQEGKWRLNLSKYGAHIQDILLLFMSIITENPVKKNGA